MSRSGVLLLGLGLAIYGIRTMSEREQPCDLGNSPGDGSLQTGSGGGQGLESTLADLLRGRRDIPPRECTNLGRQAARAAASLENYRPTKQPELWSEWTIEMRQSATQLALAGRQSDEPAMLLAAQRLNTSCVKCHEIFR